MTAQAMSAGTAETRSGSGRQPASAVRQDAPNPLYQEGYSMTDTTDQQAVAVAQEDREAARRLLLVQRRYDDPTISDGEYDETQTVQAFARHRLASVSSASEEEVGAHFFPDAAAKLHKLIAGSNVEGELPNDVRALVIAAREFWDDENSGTVRSHALDKALEAFSSRVPYDDEPTPEPVPATNQAGEVEDEDKIADMIAFGASENAPYLYPGTDQQPTRAAYCDGAADGARALLRWQSERDAALATQPATSQEAIEAGKVILEGRGDGTYAEAEQAIRGLIAHIEKPATSQEEEASSTFGWDGFHVAGNPRSIDRVDKIVRERDYLTGCVEDLRNRLAATLSEDLRWFDAQRRLSLSFYSPVYGDDDDQSEEWRVHEEIGPINDREWDVIGRGQTVAEAISAARAALNILGEA